MRNGKQLKENLNVKTIPNGNGRVGIGVSIVTEERTSGRSESEN